MAGGVDALRTARKPLKVNWRGMVWFDAMCCTVVCCALQCCALPYCDAAGRVVEYIFFIAVDLFSMWCMS